MGFWHVYMGIEGGGSAAVIDAGIELIAAIDKHNVAGLVSKHNVIADMEAGTAHREDE